jgi:signal transduction histidine kinase/class 3 adenylate cyclase/ligand-binding sensor domain-containing protein
MYPRCCRRLFLASLLLSGLLASAQGTNPFIKTYLWNTYFLEETPTQPQNWGFAQDAEGKVYLANTSGVLEFDGKSWRMIEGTGQLGVARLLASQDGHLYVGGEGDFGHLLPDAEGLLRFVSLKPQALALEAVSVRSIWEADNGICFIGAEQLWRWQPAQRSLHQVAAPARIQNAFVQGGRLCCRLEGQGIAELAEEGWALRTRAEQLLGDPVQVVLPLEAGPAERLLFVGQQGDMSLLEGGELRPWGAAIRQAFPQLEIWDAIFVPPNKVALATHNDGLIIASLDGKPLHAYDRSSGLVSNSLITVFQDRQSGLWVSSDIGISRIEYPPQLQFFGFHSALEGAVLAVVRQGGQVWVGTSNGLFRADLPDEEAYLLFEKQPLQTGEVWALADAGGDLLIATARGIFWHRAGGEFLRISEEQARTLQVSSAFPGRVYAGQDEGLRILEKSRGRWGLSPSLPGLGHAVYALAEEPDGSLWAGRFQISRVSFPPGAPPRVQTMGLAEGFSEELQEIEPLRVGQEIRFGTYNGLRRFDPQRQQLLPDETFPPRFHDGTESTYYLEMDRDGRLWMSLGKENGWFDGLSEGKPVWHAKELNPLTSSVASLYADPQGLVWIGTLEGLYRFIPSLAPAFSLPLTAQVRKVGGRDGKVIYWGGGSVGAPAEFAYAANSLRFECASSSHRFPDQVKFRFRLEGFDADWSEWSLSPLKEYNSLWEGQYRFQVQVQDIQGDISEAAEYSFRILPPWYRTWWAYGIYGLLFCLAGALLIRLILSEQRKKLAAKEEELEQERQAAERLREVDRLKDEFLANTSHELRTPLNGIIGLAESLYEQAEALEIRQNLGMVIASGKRLASLVNDLLDFSRLRHADLVLRQRPVDLRSLAEGVLQVSAPSTQGKALSLHNEVPADLPAAFADEDRLSQILYNLVGNAIKFTEKGSVWIGARLREGMIEVWVRDTGIGIPAHKQQVIFEAFEQGDGSISRTYSGTGLGLSISKTLTESHGGKMWVESEVGKGSTFYFSLPVSSEQAEPVSLLPGRRMTPLVPAPAAPALLPALPLESSEVPRFRILIADDEPINHQVLRNHLRSIQYEVVSAMDGAEALRLLAEGPAFDMVLLDVMMPRMSGYEVCKKIREQYLPSELPVIMITARNQVNDLVLGLSAGANDYLAKPFSKDEFIARLNAHISLGQINRAANRFVPNEFIQTLGRRSIADVRLGDNTSREVTVFFSDIRDYTALADLMSPEDTFRFVNGYVRRVGPVIQRNHGFVNQYLGDGVMALFQQGPEDALRAAVEMQAEIRAYNRYRQERGRTSIKAGIGFHTGPLVMGIIGDQQRSDPAVIASTVNVASRLEGLTKYFGVGILLSEPSFALLNPEMQAGCRYLGLVQVKGREEPLRIYECFSGDEAPLAAAKAASLAAFTHALDAYMRGDVPAASEAFRQLLRQQPGDMAIRHFLDQLQRFAESGLPADWKGVEVMREK